MYHRDLLASKYTERRSYGIQPASLGTTLVLDTEHMKKVGRVTRMKSTHGPHNMGFLSPR